jgi:hypothetical protein
VSKSRNSGFQLMMRRSSILRAAGRSGHSLSRLPPSLSSPLRYIFQAKTKGKGKGSVTRRDRSVTGAANGKARASFADLGCCVSQPPPASAPLEERPELRYVLHEEVHERSNEAVIELERAGVIAPERRVPPKGLYERLGAPAMLAGSLRRQRTPGYFASDAETVWALDPGGEAALNPTSEHRRRIRSGSRRRPMNGQ